MATFLSLVYFFIEKVVILQKTKGGRSQLASVNLRSFFVNDFIRSEEI
jgi:hypothetical protein